MKQSADKKEYRRHRVQTYVSPSVKQRLQNICNKYGFKSTYEVLKYLIYCFLRVADPENDPIDDPMPAEIEEMFDEHADWEKYKSSKASHAGMYIKKNPDQRKIKNPDDLSNR